VVSSLVIQTNCPFQDKQWRPLYPVILPTTLRRSWDAGVVVIRALERRLRKGCLQGTACVEDIDFRAARASGDA
jgi:hypothetical protein